MIIIIHLYLLNLLERQRLHANLCLILYFEK